MRSHLQGAAWSPPAIHVGHGAAYWVVYPGWLRRLHGAARRLDGMLSRLNARYVSYRPIR